MATSRVVMTPVAMNTYSFAGNQAIGAVAPATGVDGIGSNSGFATAWPGTLAGISYLNNGSQWLWGYNGATACSAYILIGQKAAGLVEPYTAYTVVLPTSGYFFLGPFSPQQFNQTDSSQFAGGAGGTAPGGVIGSSVNYTCIDFSATTTVAVRLYQLSTVQP